MAANSSDAGLSAYERKRLENIEKNKQVLEALGLLDGGGLIQRKSSGNTASMRRQPKEKVVIEKRERTQRSIKPVERLDPGADRLRKAAASRASAGLPELDIDNEHLDRPAPAFRKASSSYFAPPTRLDYGLSDAAVFKHFYGSKMASAFAFSAPPPAEDDDDDSSDDEEDGERPPAVDERLQVFYEGEVSVRPGARAPIMHPR